MLNGLDGSRRCWSLSALTVVDSEQAGPDSTLTALNPANAPVVRSHKDFGVLAVPAQLRYDPARQLDLGASGWTKFGLGLGCTLGEHAVIDMMRWSY